MRKSARSHGAFLQRFFFFTCSLCVWDRTRHLPRPVHKAAQLNREMLDAARVKEERRRKHTRAGENKPKAARKKVVIAEQS